VAWTLATTVIALELLASLAFVQGRQLVLDWSVAQPANWRLYEGVAPSSDRRPAIRATDLPDTIERVSFQDAAILPGSSTTGSNRIGLSRTFPDLVVGEPSVIYLQISDLPDQTRDEVLVLANGDPIWRLSVQERDESGWYDVIVPWRADTPFLFLQVERVAAGPGGSDVLVRNTHLYTRY
jgi:hypothetical protein